MTVLAPTAPGNVWQCTGCPARVLRIEDAADHAVETGHLVVEVGEDVDVSAQSGWASRAPRLVYARGGKTLVRDRRSRAA